MRDDVLVLETRGIARLETQPESDADCNEALPPENVVGELMDPD